MRENFGLEHMLSLSQDMLRDNHTSCGAWLLPNRFGLPVLEAIACSTPAIGERLVADGRGIFVEFDDPEGMAEAIRQVQEMPESEWRAMSDAAYTHAHAYTWDDATDLFGQALTQAVDTAGGGAR